MADRRILDAAFLSFIFTPRHSPTQQEMGPLEVSFRPLSPAQRVYHEKHMSVASPIYFEIIDFIAAGTTPQSVVDFRPSPEAQRRLADLIEIEKTGTLSPEQRAEVDHFTELEHILRMAKARARQIVSRGE